MMGLYAAGSKCINIIITITADFPWLPYCNQAAIPRRFAALSCFSDQRIIRSRIVCALHVLA